jgi:hypothetical protein
MAYEAGAMHFTASASQFAGLGANIDPTYDALARGYVGIRLKLHAAAPTSLILSFQDYYNDFDAGTCGGVNQPSCYARFGQTIQFGGSAEWTTVTVYWNQLVLPPWYFGPRAPFDPSTLMAFSFDVGPAATDFLIDDIEFVTQ